MPIPTMDIHGFLPPGFHDCTLREAHTAFCYTPHRRQLFLNLLRYFRLWTINHLHPLVYIDGGFSSRKAAPPKDIDVIVDIERFDLRNAQVARICTKLLDHDSIERAFGLEVFPFHRVLVNNDFTMYFQYLKPEQRSALGLDSAYRKGMLRVQI